MLHDEHEDQNALTHGNELDKNGNQPEKRETPNDSNVSDADGLDTGVLDTGGVDTGGVDTDGLDHAICAAMDDADSGEFDDGFGDGFGDDDADQDSDQDSDDVEDSEDESDESEESEKLTSRKEYVPSSVSKRQTRTYLMKRFETLGIRPRQKLGQNFLIDLNLLKLLHESAELEPCDVVLEVGTGTGSLTHAMADQAAAVVTVEIDPVVQEMAKQELAGKTNVHFILTDILRNKNSLKEEVLDLVRQELAVDSSRRFKLCANLPYSIATPLLSNLLLSDIPPCSMTVTIQKEVADRITARPGHKDYGALSVWMQAMCDTRIVRVMPPSVFWPRPKVESAIVQLIYNAKKRATIPDLPYFHSFVRDIFLHRRKYLRSVLCSAFKKQLSKDVVDRILVEQGIDETVRAENLSIRQILALSEAFRKELQ